MGLFQAGTLGSRALGSQGTLRATSKLLKAQPGSRGAADPELYASDLAILREQPEPARDSDRAPGRLLGSEGAVVSTAGQVGPERAALYNGVEAEPLGGLLFPAHTKDAVPEWNQRLFFPPEFHQI